MDDRVIREYRAKRFELHYVVQVLRGSKWEDHGDYGSGMLASITADTQARAAAEEGLDARVVERKVPK